MALGKGKKLGVSVSTVLTTSDEQVAVNIFTCTNR